MSSSRYEVEVTVTSAKELKNVSWKTGPLKPYAVVWIDPKTKCSTKVDSEGDTSPYWNDTLEIPFDTPIEDSTLYIDIVHANAEEDDCKPLVGSAKLPLRDVVDDVGLGQSVEKVVKLKRPSGRPQGKLEVKVAVREPRHYSSRGYPPPYAVPQYETRDYSAPPPPSGYNYSPYGAPPPPPPSGYPYNDPTHGQPAYGHQTYDHQGRYGQEEEKKSKYGMGTGLAVGAAAGLIGGLALSEGFDYIGDQIAEDAAEKVQDDLEDDEDEE